MVLCPNGQEGTQAAAAFFCTGGGHGVGKVETGEWDLDPDRIKHTTASDRRPAVPTPRVHFPAGVQVRRAVLMTVHLVHSDLSKGYKGFTEALWY